MGRLAVSSSFVTSGQTPPPLHARTVQIDDPGDLLARLAGASDVAWIRRGDGMVGLGVAAGAEVDSIEVGEVLEVIADDPAAEEDLKRFAKRAGHEVVSLENDGVELRILLRRLK